MRMRPLLPGRRRRGTRRRNWLRLGLLALTALVLSAGCGSTKKAARTSRSPTELALAHIRANQTQAARVTTSARSSPEGGGPTTVTVLQDGLADDSVAAVRTVLRYEPDGDGWKLVSSQRTQKCRPGRGHQDFSGADCI
jgi:hypothetical protein